ncbi:MAG: hypothetical protein J0H09_27800 [Burkholderiales bacterium]|nr:hypothetical protein [Burkholderiales bacterium]
MTRKMLALVFWVGLIGFIALDRQWSAPHDRFAEPAAIALGSGQASAGGHCSGSTR